MTHEQALALFIESGQPPPVLLLDGRPGLCLQIGNDSTMLIDAYQDNEVEQLRLPLAALIILGRGSVLQVSIDGSQVSQPCIPTIQAIHRMAQVAIAAERMARTETSAEDISGLRAISVAFSGLIMRLQKTMANLATTLNEKEGG